MGAFLFQPPQENTKNPGKNTGVSCISSDECLPKTPKAKPKLKTNNNLIISIL